MEQVLKFYEKRSKELDTEIDNIELDLSSQFEGLSQLVNLCKRVRNARERLEIIQQNIKLISNAKEELKRSIQEDFIVSEVKIRTASQNQQNFIGGLPQISIRLGDENFSKLENTNVSMLSSKSSLSSFPRKTSSRYGGQSSNLNIPSFEEITDEEFASINPKEFGTIKNDEIKNVHRIVYDYFYSEKNTKPLSKAELIHRGASARTINSSVRILKQFRRVELDNMLSIVRCYK